MEFKQISLSSNMFSVGNMLGTTGSQALMQQINQRAGFETSYFGSEHDPYKNSFHHFMTTAVQPARAFAAEVKAAHATVHKNEFMYIDSVEALKKGVPACMWVPLLSADPIRKLAQDERIEGFAVAYDDIAAIDYDPYAWLLENGKADYDNPDENGEIELTWKWRLGQDPDLSIDELDMLDTSREFITEFLMGEDTEHLDPTSIPPLQIRG